MKVVVDGMVWLDRNALEPHQIRNIIGQLTIQPKQTTTIGNKGQPDPILLYTDLPEKGLIGVPRGYYLNQKSTRHDEVIRVSRGGAMASLSTRWSATGPFAEQATAISVIESQMDGRDWGGMILQAGCSFGKTATSLELARRKGRRALILVHQGFFLRQWSQSIRKFMPDARIGIIQQDRCEYENVDFSIAMIQSLAGDGWAKYPKDMLDAFGMVITDECHRIAASTWSNVIARFSAGWRLGLTATPRRLDGAQDVFFLHVGPIAYAAKAEAMVPGVRRLFTSTRLQGISRGRYQVKVADLNSAQIVSQLSEDKFRTRAIIDQLMVAVAAKRKVLVVSERLQHLKDIADGLGTLLFDKQLGFVPRIDFYTGEWFTGEFKKGKFGKLEPKKKSRTEDDLERAESANVIMATKQMVSEGLDIQALDVIVLTTPMSDVEQAVGRVRRWCSPEPGKCEHYCPWRAGECKGKPVPIVLDVIDKECSQLVGKYRRRVKFYDSIGAMKRTGD